MCFSATMHALLPCIIGTVATRHCSSNTCTQGRRAPGCRYRRHTLTERAAWAGRARRRARPAGCPSAAPSAGAWPLRMHVTPASNCLAGFKLDLQNPGSRPAPAKHCIREAACKHCIRETACKKRRYGAAHHEAGCGGGRIGRPCTACPACCAAAPCRRTSCTAPARTAARSAAAARTPPAAAATPAHAHALWALQRRISSKRVMQKKTDRDDAAAAARKC